MKFSARAGAGALILAVSAFGCTSDPAVLKQKYLTQGDEKFEQKQYAEAAIEYRKAIQQDAKYGEAHYKLARSYDQLGERVNATREYSRAADLLTDNVAAQVDAGARLLAVGSFEDAKARALRALALEPKNVEARLVMAQALAGMKDLNGGAAEIEEAIQMDPDQPRSYIGLGVFRQAQGNLDLAEKAFNAAVTADPTSIDATLAIAQFYAAHGRKEAEEWLKKAVALAPADPYSNRALAVFYLRANRMEDAKQPLEAFAAGTSSPRPRLTLADYYFATRRNADARAVLEPLTKDPSVFSEVRQRLSILAFAEGHKAEAYKWVDEILAKNASDARASELKGRYLLADREFDRAREALKAAVASNPSSPTAHYWLGIAYTDSGQLDAAGTEFGEVQRLKPHEVDSKLQLAELNLLQGNTGAAATLVGEAVALEPNNLKGRLVLVDVLSAQGDVARATKEAQTLAPSPPEAPEAQAALGRVLMRKGDFAAAERAFERAVQLSGGSVETIGLLVDAKISMGKIAEARSLAEQYIAKDAKQAWYRVYAARAYRASHDEHKAEEALKTALTDDSNNLAAYLDLTRLYVQQNDLDAARSQLELIVARQPKAVWAQTMIAVSLQLQNRLPDAKQRYETVLGIDPNAAIAANNLAQLLADEGQDLDRALNLAQAAKRQLPDSPEVNDTLGSVYLKKGLANLAVAPLELSVRKQPGDPMYQYHLAMAYIGSGDQAKGRSALERALSLKPDFDGSVDARRALAGLARSH
jgi:tetratricopeptide (TPR) repeat protein